ncbi:hypothetical protein [Rhizobium sp. CNPSo 4039]|uniref:hypothetical protein n=1 Tax=Rhizobium sp. CNPSo 4039 TaxID=3021409 RepID=UPI00254C5A17|nr:hypothetical protein [Rhizobium sp. CNPSo 4039]MDK4713543.1 hypothetical protein [Rhizobium sp. CNPSo 4039]
MEMQRSFERRRPTRGVPYCLADFQKKYGLDDATAEDLFVRFGPSSVELDLLMAAKRKMLSFDDLTNEMPLPSAGPRETNPSSEAMRALNGQQRRKKNETRRERPAHRP